ncbi:hypothetical protein ACHAXR_007303 [Thalassiosira sp. AJA248-18]
MTAFAVSLVVVVAVAVAVTASLYYFANENNRSNDFSYDDVAKTKDPTEGMEIPTFSGNISDFIVANENARQSPFDANICPIGESLWNLLLITDNYAWETKWELHHSINGVMASGPPEGTNYYPRTRYMGNLCLTSGQYYMRWFDMMGDSLCCKYGQGGWTVSVNGEVVLENDPDDSNFTQRDFPFQITSASSGGGAESEMVVLLRGTFLIMPRPNEPVMNVELPDGTVFELSNLPPDFGYAERGLVSGVTSITLPLGTELNISDGTADMKGEAPRVGVGRRLRSVNLRASYGNRRQLANFKGYQTVLAVRVIAQDDETSNDETLLSNSIFGNGIDPVNLVSQFKACSYGKMNLIKAAQKSGKAKNSSGDVKISNGVVTVCLPSISTTDGDATMRNAITTELNGIFGVANPSQLADYIMYCLPPGTYIGAREGEGGKPYDDETGIMGYSYPNNNAPRSCFNAAKSWQTGWYKDKSITINSNGVRNCFIGILHGVADYSVATTVLLRIQTRSGNDYYVNFNAKKGINAGTQEGGNQVTVVIRPRGARDSYAESDLVAKLGSGESYAVFGYVISIDDIDKKAGTAAVVVLPTGRDVCEIV